MFIVPVDSKGGITLPKSFREKCSGKVVVKEADGCLEIHPLLSYKEPKGKYP